jgi:hypothetical protein
MTLRLSTGVARSTVVIGCTVTLAFLFSTRIANTQGASSTAQQISALREQISALDRRVKDLERAAITVDQDKPEPTTAMDRRVAALEAEVRSLQSHATTNRTSGGSEASGQIVAPFSVVDSAGKPLMRVTDGGNGFSRGIYIYNSNASIVAHIGTLGEGGGRVYVTKNGELPMALMAAGSEGGAFQLGAGDKRSVVIDKSYMVFYADGGSNPLSVFGTKSRGKGYMELNDSGGSKMVEAGMLKAGVGYVMTNPARSSVSPSGNPSVLMGGAGR